jgi:hypothetical protein
MPNSELASVCLADYVLVCDQHSCNDPVSSCQVPMTSNLISLFARLAAMSAQQAKSGYKEAIIYALRNKEDEKLAKAKKDNTSLEPSQEPSYTIREVLDNEIQPESTQQGNLMTGYESRVSSYSWLSVFELQTDYDPIYTPRERLSGPVL